MKCDCKISEITLYVQECQSQWRACVCPLPPYGEHIASQEMFCTDACMRVLVHFYPSVCNLGATGFLLGTFPNIFKRLAPLTRDEKLSYRMDCIAYMIYQFPVHWFRTHPFSKVCQADEWVTIS
jgi:hypothetical protein